MTSNAKIKNIIEVTDFTQKEWEVLIQETIAFKKNKYRKIDALKNKFIGLLFSNNSLRTRISFEIATHLLGGVSYFLESQNLTNEKDGIERENRDDIINTLDRMIDYYVVRDYSGKTLEAITRIGDLPVINGFCSVGHPSQALGDMAVIEWKKGTNKNLVYTGVCSENGSGIMESFIYAVLLLGEKIILITPTGEYEAKNKNFNAQVEDLSKKYGGYLKITKEIHDTIAVADVLYVDEWWENTTTFLQKDIGEYRVDKNFLQRSKKDLIILHYLPAHWDREIEAEVIRGPQSIIFDEAEFRIYSAMSLLCFLREKNEGK